MSAHGHRVICRIFAPKDPDLEQRMFSLFGTTPLNNDGISLRSNFDMQYTNELDIQVNLDHASLAYGGSGYLVQFEVLNTGFLESEEESIHEIGQLYWRLLQKLIEFHYEYRDSEITPLLMIDDCLYQKDNVDFGYEDEEFFEQDVLDIFLPDPYPTVYEEPIVIVDNPYYLW